MKNILITLLGKESQIIPSASLITTLKENNPNSCIEVLTFKRFQKITQTINNVDVIHTIDQEKISSILKSPLYSDAFAINSFFQSIFECSHTKWDLLVNYSNDLTSSYLASYFDVKEIAGTHIAKMGNPVTNNSWANYRNFVSPKAIGPSISFLDSTFEMLNIPIDSSCIPIKTKTDFNIKAKNNFDKIRNRNSVIEKKIIGINIEHSFLGRFFSKDMIKSLIEDILLDESLEVVLLTKKTAREIKTINTINNHFNNKIVSISSNEEALPSILKNLDVLISLENSSLLTADALKIQCIEIKDGESHSGSFMLNENYCIYTKDTNSIKNDLAFILNQILDSTLSVDKISSNNKSYLLIKDDYGHLQTQINGEVDTDRELHYLFKRYYHYLLMKKLPSAEFINHLKKHVPINNLLNFQNMISEQIELGSRICLNAIRNAPVAYSSSAASENFLKSLDLINDMTHKDLFISAAFSLFEGRIEKLPSGEVNKNIKLIEAELYQLKKDLQIARGVLKSLDLSESTLNHINI